MQLDDQLAELQNDLEGMRRRIETEGLKAVDRMHEHNEEMRAIWSRIDRLRHAYEQERKGK